MLFKNPHLFKSQEDKNRERNKEWWPSIYIQAAIAVMSIQLVHKIIIYFCILA